MNYHIPSLKMLLFSVFKRKKYVSLKNNGMKWAIIILFHVSPCPVDSFCQLNQYLGLFKLW